METKIQGMVIDENIINVHINLDVINGNKQSSPINMIISQQSQDTLSESPTPSDSM